MLVRKRLGREVKKVLEEEEELEEVVEMVEESDWMVTMK